MKHLLQFVLTWIGNLAVGFGAFCFGFGPVAWLGQLANYPRTGAAIGMILGVINAALAVVYLVRRQADDSVEFDP